MAPSRAARLVAALPQLRLPVEGLLLLGCAWFALLGNRRFVQAALSGRSVSDASAWGFGAALIVGLLALHLLLLAPLSTRWTVKPVLAAAIVTTAFATYYMQQYGVYLDPSMLRNVLRTDWHEASELLGPSLGLHLLLYAALPLLVLWRVQLVLWSWKRSLLMRLALLVAAVGVLVAALLSVFQPFSSLMRNHKEMRYLITPANLLWSSSVVAADEWRGAAKPKAAIGLDAKPGPSWAQRRKPLVVVLVVGETARAANWGLSGYARQTTPELAKLPVVNFPDVSACGTNTETSLRRDTGRSFTRRSMAAPRVRRASVDGMPSRTSATTNAANSGHLI